MDTKTFLFITGIKHPEYLARYKRKGIINPKKVNGKNDYSDMDVQNVQRYLDSGKAREFEKSELDKVKDRLTDIEATLETLKSSITFLTKSLT